ncbi:hypothetical protein EYC59_03950 [Candidatus Saccharibacteria bacterium]|nr:MAG: hypothetical protein EYC59_03950 [Candidatus Saccharibacteria bacterium]
MHDALLLQGGASYDKEVLLPTNKQLVSLALEGVLWGEQDTNTRSSLVEGIVTGENKLRRAVKIIPEHASDTATEQPHDSQVVMMPQSSDGIIPSVAKLYTVADNMAEKILSDHINEYENIIQLQGQISEVVEPYSNTFEMYVPDARSNQRTIFGKLKDDTSHGPVAWDADIPFSSGNIRYHFTLDYSVGEKLNHIKTVTIEGGGNFKLSLHYDNNQIVGIGANIKRQVFDLAHLQDELVGETSDSTGSLLSLIEPSRRGGTIGDKKITIQLIGGNPSLTISDSYLYGTESFEFVPAENIFRGDRQGRELSPKQFCDITKDVLGLVPDTPKIS